MIRPSTFLLACLLFSEPVISQTSITARTGFGPLGDKPSPARLIVKPHLTTPSGRGLLFEDEEGMLDLRIVNGGGTAASNVSARVILPPEIEGLIVDSVHFVGDVNPGDTAVVHLPLATTVVRARRDVAVFIEVGDSAGYLVREPLIVSLERSSRLNDPGSTVPLAVNETLSDILSAGRNWLFVIGINRYEQWPELQTPVNDARAFRDLMIRRYGFEQRYLIELYDENGTRGEMIKGFEYLAQRVRPEDNVVIYYGGHGKFDKAMNRGYWVPVNGEPYSTAEYLANTELHAFISAINSRATLVISDACFSGTLFRGPEDATERYFREVAKLRARQALISGGNEPVMDTGLSSNHSVFAHYLLNRLSTNQEKYLTVSDLFDRIKLPISNSSLQTPQCRPIGNTGDEGGQFVFVRYR
jgi:hypothetical protein